MQITSICPGCQTVYHLSPELRGKTIRCPDASCGSPIVVVERPAPTQPARPAEPPRSRSGTATSQTWSGSVNDLLSVLPAESADYVEPIAENDADFTALPEPQPVEASWRQQPPPPRQEPVAPARGVAARNDAERDGGERFSEHPALAIDEATPADEVVDEADDAPEEEHVYADEEQTRKRKRLRNWLVVGGSVMGVAAVTCIGFVLVQILSQTEETKAKAAYKNFEDRRYAPAANDFGILLTSKTSTRLDEYQAMIELSEALASFTSGDQDRVAGLEGISKFLETHSNDKTVKEHSSALGKEIAEVVSRIAEQERNEPNDGSPQLLDSAAARLARVSGLFPDAVEPGQLQTARAAIEMARAAHATWAKRLATRDSILALVSSREIHPADAIKSANRTLRFVDREFPGMSADPAIVKALGDAYERHGKSVIFVPAGETSPSRTAPSNLPTSILVVPAIGPEPTPQGDRDAVVLSLARGVLHAHSRATGAIRWAVRVGVDTTTLPVRVPATTANPERILVQLADAETLVAFDPEGQEVWRYRLGSPSLGKPVVVEPFVFLATYDGQVHEVELTAGRLQGRYELGQRLSVGGVREGKSDTIYFPADDFCVYAIDTKKRACAAILYSDHPAGSLRGEPLVVAPGQKPIGGGNATQLPGFLILNQTDGLDATRLRVFPLPFAERDGPQLQLNPEPRLAGWTWFTPFHDSEKIVAATDAGDLGLFGIQQAGNKDDALFPLLTTLKVDETALANNNTRGRAQVVQAQGDDFWVLAKGKLQRMAMVWNAAVGPKLVPAWREALDLGSPLHASQIEEDRESGQNTLVVVTRSLRQQLCEASAIRDDDGKVLWQRQLGLVCRGAPIALRNGDKPAEPIDTSTAALAAGFGLSLLPPAAPADLLLALDLSGALFTIDPPELRPLAGGWLRGARPVPDAPAFDDNPAFPPLLLPGADGTSAIEIACPGSGKRLIVRHIRLDDDGRQVKIVDVQSVELTSIPVGTPLRVGEGLVVPFDSGVLGWLPLKKGGELKLASNWRSDWIGSEAKCHLAALSDNLFLASDGGKGLTVWKLLNANGDMEGVLSEGKSEVPTLELDDRIDATPLVIHEATKPTQVLIADRSGVLHRLRLTERNGLVEQKDRVTLDGPVTAGPFLRAHGDSSVRVGCIVGGTSVVWIDPEKSKILWQTPALASAIVGEPQIVDGQLIVADQAGRLMALDLKSGKRLGEGYTLPGSNAPAATPVEFPGGKLLTPLTDGTLMLVPMQWLKAESIKKRPTSD